MTNLRFETAPQGVFPPAVQQACRRSMAVVLAALLAISAALAAVALLSPSRAFAAGNQDDRPAGLYFKTGQPDEALEAPLLQSNVEIDVNGLVAHVTLRQHFRNPTEAWLEGIYVFPLPEQSAVNHLVMKIGDKRVAGHVMEKAEAKKTYQEAAAAGQHASLLSSERPNVFMTSVANIGPGEIITVEISYQDKALYENGRFSYRFPMVVAPRFTPPARQIAEGPSPQAAALAAGDGRDVFGPVLDPETGKINPIRLSVSLDPGMALSDLKSLYHDVIIESQKAHRQKISLSQGTVPTDKDFVIEWAPKSSDSPQTAFFGEEVEGSSHTMILVVPPKAAEAPVPPARELVFVLDTSGSMHGDSIEQAKAALARALKHLRPEDRFNVIQFNNETSSLFPAAADANQRNLYRALRYVAGLEAEGGTMMRPALERALRDAPMEGLLRQVVFLTDGAVSNEDELFQQIAARIGENRLFTIGIGSAPNSYFMRKASQVGRGSFTYIGKPEEVEDRITALLDKLARPALTDIAVEWPAGLDAVAEFYPNPIPDLYDGEPILLTARLAGAKLSDLSGSLKLRGKRLSEAWEGEISLKHIEPATGVASIWARSKFEDVEDGVYRGRPAEEVRSEALDLALAHQLVTRYTSLVAVDETPVRDVDDPLHRLEIPRNLPDGWDYGKVFGEAESPVQLKALPRSLMHEAQAAGATYAASTPISLPRGATVAEIKAIAGIAALLLGNLLLLFLLRRRKGGVGHA